MSKKLMSAAAAMALLIAACGGEDADADFSFGAPGDPGQADRVVEILVTDQLVFEPSRLTVTAGDTVTFRITNEGHVLHDFTLGDREAQDRHSDEMAQGGHDVHDAPNVVEIHGGDTAEITWTFVSAGQVLIGCHQPGHYGAGMTGVIEVQEA